MGGARLGRSRHSSIASVVTGGCMAARILIGLARQWGHSRTSISKTRFINSGHEYLLGWVAAQAVSRLASAAGISIGTPRSAA
jgi:hypothetical protein